MIRREMDKRIMTVFGTLLETQAGAAGYGWQGFVAFAVLSR